jgi:hypothetical protein
LAQIGKEVNGLNLFQAPKERERESRGKKETKKKPSRSYDDEEDDDWE